MTPARLSRPRPANAWAGGTGVGWTRCRGGLAAGTAGFPPAGECHVPVTGRLAIGGTSSPRGSGGLGSRSSGLRRLHDEWAFVTATGFHRSEGRGAGFGEAAGTTGGKAAGFGPDVAGAIINPEPVRCHQRQGTLVCAEATSVPRDPARLRANPPARVHRSGQYRCGQYRSGQWVRPSPRLAMPESAMESRRAEASPRRRRAAASRLLLSSPRGVSRSNRTSRTKPR